MEEILEKVHKGLLRSGRTVAAAESCTGGMLSSLLTSRSGASAYFIFGAVVYSNLMKNRILGIELETIGKHGAVSKEVALAMASGARYTAKTDIGIGITGIAGPSGGTKNKPAGTVYIAAVSGKKKLCKRFNFKGNRQSVRRQSCAAGLDLLNRLIPQK